MDTSALLAVLDADDVNHDAAEETWRTALEQDWQMTCNNYVLVETMALVQRRLGLDALRIVHEDIAPLLVIDWLDAAQHSAAASALLLAKRRRLSLVDCTSFETARRRGIRSAFTFDRHFAEQGLECLPRVDESVR